MAVLTYKGGKYRNLAGNKIFDGSRWQNMTSDSKIFIDGAWHDFSWARADVPSVPELPDWDSWEHLATEEPTSGTVRYMTPTGNGKKDGSSWSNAFSATQIHVALLSSADGDRLYLAEGDYGTLDRPLTATGTITLCGGFVEGDYSWNTRDAFNHPTYFKGDGSFAFAGAGIWNIDGVTLDGFANANAEVSLTNVTGSNAGWHNGDVFSNCRFVGGGGCHVYVSTADTCYFAGNAGDNLGLLALTMRNSVVTHCEATEGFKFLGSYYYALCETAENSVISEISLQGEKHIALLSTGCQLYNCTCESSMGGTESCMLRNCTEGIESGGHSGDVIMYSVVGAVSNSTVVGSTIFA